MTVDLLVPRPTQCEPFRGSSARFVPARPGCYVLASFSRTVLYVGLASNLRKRMAAHFDDPRKTGATASGRAVWFFWIESAETSKIERTWMNICIQHEGRLPEMNRVFSPVVI